MNLNPQGIAVGEVVAAAAERQNGFTTAEVSSFPIQNACQRRNYSVKSVSHGEVHSTQLLRSSGKGRKRERRKGEINRER